MSPCAPLIRACEVQLAYAIGVAHPVSVMVDTFGKCDIDSVELVKMVQEIFPLTPEGIIEHLQLRRPIYAKTSSYGHFGRELPEFTWEKTDKIDEIKQYFK